MSKHDFKHGLILGAVLGTAYTIYQRTKATSATTAVDTIELKHDTKLVTQNFSEFQHALKHLKHEIELTLQPTTKAIQQDISEFQFQVEPRLERLKQLSSDLESSVTEQSEKQ
ncbi:hypothetical protein FC15_GL001038 [Lapidilactobacillus concavus DSM 17758]|uniref:Uncharacterized protein n=1 Tax=Lapidilactobacillus concavus DSM 17758 TaxID=1423735 RepID=A0A0R1W061_9LACO|nr:hypothetical protein [Lapidilactobacillus concavus]KRM11272.1 hypothetical protein FC15_GL001038 [Lapidilactobacillus concavus DSM 17758]GEL13456.1 hypothetical protein LCO01nite_10050 [Lapidilactobacillus concavus]